MHRFFWSLLAILLPGTIVAQQSKVIVKDLNNPTGITSSQAGKVFVLEGGQAVNDGKVLLLEKGQAVSYYSGLENPQAIAAYQQWLFVADKKGIWKIGSQNKGTLVVPIEKVPNMATGFRNLVADPESGTVYFNSDGDPKNKSDAIYRLDPKGKISTVLNPNKLAEMGASQGLLLDGASFLLMVDQKQTLHRINIALGNVEKVAEGFQGRLAWDYHGRLFGFNKEGGLLAIPRPGEKPVPLGVKFQHPVELCLAPGGKELLVADSKAGTVSAVPINIPGWEVDNSPLSLETALAFPKMKWTGWEPVDPKGIPAAFRPIILTHAGDGSNRIFMATQHGVIHVFPNDPNVDKSRIFLDIQDRVFYSDNENEQGFLGLTFHPQFKKNGELFIFYTKQKDKTTNVVSRFRLGKDDPHRVDPNSEEVIFSIKRPFWNHDGGTICFGPDGYLYIALGDGGAANDPFNNAQNLSTLLGSILRIDINAKDPGKNYAIPKDNPFVGRQGTQPEIWAYGLRNVWRMSFDRKTGKLWAGDVGQNLFEEINIITKGGNYGWKLREGLHPFWQTGVGPRPDLIEPLWEYHHDIGKSITGGFVYRGKQFPELEGHFLYADYVSGKIWALLYDEDKKRVVANRTIQDKNLPIMSFGEDEQGEAYLLTYSPTGQGVYKLARSKK